MLLLFLALYWPAIGQPKIISSQLASFSRISRLSDMRVQLASPSYGWPSCITNRCTYTAIFPWCYIAGACSLSRQILMTHQKWLTASHRVLSPQWVQQLSEYLHCAVCWFCAIFMVLLRVLCDVFVLGLSCQWLPRLITACSLAFRSYRSIATITFSSANRYNTGEHCRYTAVHHSLPVCWYTVNDFTYQRFGQRLPAILLLKAV